LSIRSSIGGSPDETPWFLFGAILFGMMARSRPGAQASLSGDVARRQHTYARLLLGLILSDFLLTFWCLQELLA